MKGRANPVTFNIKIFDDKLKDKINDFIEECKDVTIKKDLLVMVTKNIDVHNGLCNGTV